MQGRVVPDGECALTLRMILKVCTVKTVSDFPVPGLDVTNLLLQCG
jgi:hypothetical protein